MTTVLNSVYRFNCKNVRLQDKQPQNQNQI